MNKALIAVLLVALLAVARADPIANDEPEMPSVDADVEEHEQAMEDVEESGVGHLKGDGGNSDSKLDAKETKDSNPDSDLEEDVEENDEQPEADVEEEASRHNSEANKIRRLLSKIKAKLIRELRNAKRYVARVQARENKRVAAARRRYVRATRRSRHQHNIRMRDLGRYRAARRRRVRVMRHSRLHQKRVVLRRERTCAHPHDRVQTLRAHWCKQIGQEMPQSSQHQKEQIPPQTCNVQRSRRKGLLRLLQQTLPRSRLGQILLEQKRIPTGQIRHRTRKRCCVRQKDWSLQSSRTCHSVLRKLVPQTHQNFDQRQTERLRIQAARTQLGGERG